MVKIFCIKMNYMNIQKKCNNLFMKKQLLKPDSSSFLIHKRFWEKTLNRKSKYEKRKIKIMKLRLLEMPIVKDMVLMKKILKENNIKKMMEMKIINMLENKIMIKE